MKGNQISTNSQNENPSDVVNVSIVGCGLMGERHFTSCLQLPGVKISSLIDPCVEKAQALAGDSYAKVFSDVSHALSTEPPDAVVVATPPGFRRKVVEQVVSVGSGVFVEKPIALDMESVRAMCRSIDQTPVVNSAGFHLRYSPLAREAQGLIAGRKVDHVRSVTTTSYYLAQDMPIWYLQRRHSGGPLLEQSIHMIDMARFLVGDIIKISAIGRIKQQPGLPNADSEDSMVLSFRFKNGALGSHIDSCSMSEFNWEVQMFGEDWRLQVDFARNRLSGWFEGQSVEKDLSTGDYHLLEMEAFVSAVRQQRQDFILSSFYDAGVTLSTVLAARNSLDADGEWQDVSAGVN